MHNTLFQHPKHLVIIDLIAGSHTGCTVAVLLNEEIVWNKNITKSIRTRS